MQAGIRAAIILVMILCGGWCTTMADVDPGSLQIDKTGGTDVVLSWQGGVAPYEVYRAPSPENIYQAPNLLATTGGTMYEDPLSVIPGELVFYRVRNIGCLNLNDADCDDGDPCSSGVCLVGDLCSYVDTDQFTCNDDFDSCTYDSCGGGTCNHTPNDPPVSEVNVCAPAAALTADTGRVTGSWSDCGAADNFEFNCPGGVCSYTGAISTWGCANPDFLYDGPDTGYEYAYSFLAPFDGTCTFFEYNEGYSPGPPSLLQGVIDWFILSGGYCTQNNCINHIWENLQFDPRCSPERWCSYSEFQVSEGQLFYIVADIYDGLVTLGHEAYPYQDSWNVEVKCQPIDNP